MMVQKIQLHLGSPTIKKSEKLGVMPDPDDNNNWLVQGGSGSEYEVSYDEKSNSFVCYKNNKNRDLCQGWKFCKGSGDSKQCSHIIAVVLKDDKFELVQDE